MNINWKHLATTSGYKSLKAAYIKDVQASERDLQRGRNPMRRKPEFQIQFRKIINHAIKISSHTGEPIDSILNRWESKRIQWWMNYDGLYEAIPNTDALKPQGLKGAKKYYKNARSIYGKSRYFQHILFEARQKNEKNKKRWDMNKKANAKYWRERQ